MKSITTALKRFLANKNTVTILGLLVAVFVLYLAYNYRIDQKTNPVSIPYAKITIQPKTEITEDMVAYMKVPKSAMKGNVITNSNFIIGQYSNYNTVIPVGSMFYKDAVVPFKDLPDSAFADIKKGDTVFNFKVDMESTYGNSLFPGNYIDVYFKGINDSGEIMYGQLYKNIKILAVKDSKGMSVFQNSESLGTPSMLLFAVPNEMYLILKKAAYLKTTTAAELILVPVTEKVTGKPTITSTNLVAYIEAKTMNVPQDMIDAAAEEQEAPKPEINEETE